MARYHIHPRTGDPGVCRAAKYCPFGDLEEDHFSTIEEARAAFERRASPLDNWLASSDGSLEYLPLTEEELHSRLHSIDSIATEKLFKEKSSLYAKEEWKAFLNNENIFIRTSAKERSGFVLSSFYFLEHRPIEQEFHSEQDSIYRFSPPSADLEIYPLREDGERFFQVFDGVNPVEPLRWKNLTRTEKDAVLPLMWKPFYSFELKYPQTISIKDLIKRRSFILKGFSYGR